MDKQQDTGATPLGSGCQPTASAADASSQSGIPSACDLIERLVAGNSRPGFNLAMVEAAEEITRLRAKVASISAVRDGYASQMKFCDIEALGFYREFVRRIEAALGEAGNRALPVQTRLADDDSAKAARRQPGKGERLCERCNGTGTETNDCEFARWAQGCDICEGMGVLPLVRPAPITRPIEHDVPGFSGFLDGLADHIAAQGTPTRSAETTGSVGEADGGPVPAGDAS